MICLRIKIVARRKMEKVEEPRHQPSHQVSSMNQLKDAGPADPTISTNALNARRGIKKTTWIRKAGGRGFSGESELLNTHPWIYNGVRKVFQEGCQCFTDSEGKHCLVYNCYPNEHE